MNETVVARAPVVTIGANFSGSNVSASGLVPPDSEGAVGPGQFVELINGVYRVYDKTGTVLQQSSSGDSGVDPMATRERTQDDSSPHSMLAPAWHS